MINFFKGFGLGLCIFIFFIFGLLVNKIQLFFDENKDAMEIHRKISIEKDVDYDNFVAYPRFSASKFLSTKESLSDDDKMQITQLFDKVLKRVESSQICSGGSYFLQQNIAYDKGINFPYGYDFSSAFECEFNKNDIDSYQTLLKDINEILKDNDYIVLNVPAIRPIFSDKLIKQTQEKLYSNGYDAAVELAKHYSLKTNKVCNISSISYYYEQNDNNSGETNIYLSSFDSGYLTKKPKQKLDVVVLLKCK